MSLKSSIVVKSQFTLKGADGEGSRGSTPGAYVERYMGRDGASEPCLPVAGTGPYDYLQRYVARRDAVESAPVVADAYGAGVRSRGRDGVAFGADSVSMSDGAFKQVSRRIQDLFDAGEPVLKTVLSFDTDYLKARGVVRDELVVSRPGDLRGEVDQLRLREAVREGMRALSHRFDDLVWVGVLQFDTEHVHAHLAMAESDLDGSSRRRPDGEHRGVLSAEEIGLIRRGVDRSLDLTQTLPRLTAQVSRQRKGVRSFVAERASRELARSGTMQLVVATLPDDARMWRAGSASVAMSRPLALVRAFVRDMFAEQGSGYAEVRASVGAYARERAARDGGGAARERELVENGLARVEDECVNAVFAEVRRWQERPAHTRAIDVMASDIAEAARLASTSAGDEAWFRLRTYGGRMVDAREKRQRAHDERRRYERDAERGNVAPGSEAYLAFLLAEERYQTQVMCKYQGLLPLVLVGDDDEEDLELVKRALDEVRGLEDLLTDDRMLGMSAEEAERFGRVEHGVSGGALLARDPRRFAARLEVARTVLDERVEEARFALASGGRVLTLGRDGVRVRPGTLMRFEDVRGVDLHRLGYDFPDAAPVGSEAFGQFERALAEREEALRGAVRYLVASHQEQTLDQLPVAEVARMGAVAREVAETGVVRSLRHDGNNRSPILTVRTEPEAVQGASDAVARTIAVVRSGIARDAGEVLG